TDSHRLCTIEDGWVERFGQDILISFKRVLSRERLVAELQSWTSSVGFDVGRIFARFVPRKNEQREPPRLIFGDPGEKLQTIATERHLKFGIDFGTGYSPGLFLDQRENRRYVRHISPKRVLNCFAYTCSFSVSAAYVERLPLTSICLKTIWLGDARILPSTAFQQLSTALSRMTSGPSCRGWYGKVRNST